MSAEDPVVASSAARPLLFRRVLRFGDAPQVAATARSLWLARLVGVASIAVFVVVRLVRMGSPGGFVVAGTRFVHANAPRELFPLSIHGGYDGQFVYRLALDPFTRVRTAFGITLDTPAYRQQRIGTALLAHVVAWLPGIGTALALVLVNAIALAVAVFAGTRIAADLERHPAWGLVLAAPACMPISLGRDLTEPVAWAGILVAFALARRRRWLPAALALTVAVLARETSLVVVGGLGAGVILDALRGRGRDWKATWLLIPVAVEAAWQGWLYSVWGTFPLHTGQSNNVGWPFASLFGQLFKLSGDHPVTSVAYILERLAVLGLVLVAAALLVSRRSAVPAGLGFAWLFAVLIGLSDRQWNIDVGFLRASYEAWGLSVFVLLYARPWPARYVLGGAGAVTLAIALMRLAIAGP